MINKRIWQVSLVVAALIAVAGVAAATEHEDTTFNYGYDSANRLLLINTIAWGEGVEATDAPCQFDTILTNDTGTNRDVTYTSVDPIEVTPLVLDEGTETAETCDLQAAEVSGPNGQVNHGMIMKAFKTLYDGARRGCVNRYLAQSDFGKDDQQVQAGEEASTFVPSLGTFPVEFFTALADCEKSDNGETAGLQGNGNGKGRPEWAGQKGGPNSAGQSGSAPGRDR